MLHQVSLPLRSTRVVFNSPAALRRHPIRCPRGVSAKAEEPGKSGNEGLDRQQQSPTGDGASISTTTTIDTALLQLPKETIERLKMTVFGFDTFWVTSVDNYKEDGVVFKGNVRGKDPVESFKKMKARLKAELGDAYELFLMEDREDKPTAVILPAASVKETDLNSASEVWLAIVFGLCTVVTTMNANGVPFLEWLIDPFRTEITGQDIVDAVPGALAFWSILGIHEWGHRQAAAKSGTQMCLPFFVPAGFGFLGSFGAISRFKGILPDRQTLLDISYAGPVAGAAASAAVLSLGFILTGLGLGDFELNTPMFADSALVAVAAQAFLSDELAQPTVEVSGLLIAGWAGLIVNALNCVPAGELDGGRIAMSLWGRKTANVLAAVSIVLMSVAAIGGNSLSLYWVLLILVLQRGPVSPCSDELNPPRNVSASISAAAVLALPLVVLLPFPFELINGVQDFLGSLAAGGSLTAS